MTTKPKSETTENLDSLEAVKTWISGTGYPLEFYVADIFSKSNFKVTQSYHVTDLNLGKTREIDVIATVEKDQLSASFVIECKYSIGKPWIAFSSQTNNLPPERYIQATIATEDAEDRIRVLMQDSAIQNLEMFRGFDRSVYMVKQAHTDKGEDLPYHGIQSVSGNAMNLLAQTNRQDRHLTKIFIPIVVIDGFLFECFYENGVKVVDSAPRHNLQVHWRGSSHRHLINVDIVPKGCVAEYAHKRLHEVNILLDRMSMLQRGRP